MRRPESSLRLRQAAVRAAALTCVVSILWVNTAASAECGIARATRTLSNAGRVDWSEHGPIVYDAPTAGSGGRYELYVLANEKDPSRGRCLTCNVATFAHGHAGNPAWHPSGRWIVFQAESLPHPGGSRFAQPGLGLNNNLWLTDARGQEFHQLTRLPADGRHGVLHPHFSRDGRLLSWSELKRPARWGSWLGQWVLKVAEVHLEEGRIGLENERSFEPGGPAFYENHGFLPDGAGLLFTSQFESPRALLTGTEVYRMHLDGGAPLRLTDRGEYDEHAAFSPDGSWISWMSSRGNPNHGTDYWRMRPDGSEKERLTSMNLRECIDSRGGARVIAADHSWRADGKQFFGYVQKSLLEQTGDLILFELP